MAEKVDAITLEIEATTEKADKGIDKTIESLRTLKTALNGINTKKLKQEMESFEDFQKKLQTAFSNIKVSGNTEELRKQITQAEARLDTLLSKENKLKTVSGVNENSKQYRNLQYDIADVCNTLDQLYAAMDKVNAQKPLNFWEKPNWAENLQNYGTTDESIIKSRLGSVEDVEKVESVATYAANKAAQNVQKMGGKMQTLKGIAEQLKTAFSGIREKNSLGSGAEKFNADMQDLIDGMNQAKYTMKQMESGAKAFDSTTYERAAQDLAEASEQMRNYKNSLTGATEQTSRLKMVLSGISGVVKGAFAKLGSIGSGIVAACKKAAGALRGLKSQIPKLGAAFNGLGKKIRSVTRLFAFMVLRRAITALLNTMKQGFDTLAQYSAAKGTEFNKNISSMQSGLKQLGNSIVAAFEPLINAVTPIINDFISKLTEATNAIGQFFAALTGKSTFTHAKKVVGNYAASLDKATASTKKLATATAGIDELNILQDNDNSGGDSGASNPADSFETEKVGDKFANLAQMIKDAWGKADFSKIGGLVAEKINSALENINWDAINNTTQKIAQSIATFVNGSVENLDWSLVGITLGNSINTAVLFANTLLSSINWQAIGASIATGLNSTITTIDWGSIGNLISNSFNMVIDSLYGTVNTFDFSTLGENLGTAVTTAVGGIEWSKGGAAIGLSVSGLLDTFSAFIETTDFAQIGQAIVSAIGGFFENLSWESIGESLSGAFKALLDFISGTVSGVNWDNVPKYIVTAISDFFSGFDWSGVSQNLGQLLWAAVRGAVDLMGSIWDMIKNAWGDLSDYFTDYIEDAGGDIINGLWNGITDALANVGEWIVENIFGPFVDGFRSAFGIHSPSKEMKPLGGYIVDGVLAGITDKWNGIIDFFSNGLTDIKNGFSDGWENIKKNTGAAWDRIKSAFSDSWVNVKNGVSSSWTTIKSSFSTSWSSITDGVKNSWLSITQRFTSSWTTIKNGVSDSWNMIKGNFASAWVTVTTGVKNSWESIKLSFSSAWGAVTRGVSDAWTTIKAGFTSGMSNSLSSVKIGWTNIKESFTSGVSAIIKSITDIKWSDIGSNIVDGIWKGISDGWKWLTDKVKNLANDLFEAAKDALGIHSPSRKFAEIGRYSVLGFNQGLSENAKSSLRAVRDWFAPLENVTMSTRLSVNDAGLRACRANYGEDFSRDISVQRYTHNIMSGSVQASITADNPITAAFKEIAEAVIVPAIQGVEVQAKRQADKNEQTIVEIGGKTITDAVREQKSRNGFSFQPT